MFEVHGRSTLVTIEDDLLNGIYNNKQGEFVESVIAGDVDRVKELISDSSARLNLNCTGYLGYTVLELAVLENRSHVVRLLLELDDTALHLENAIFVAVRDENISILRDLLDKQKSLENAGIIKKPDANVCFPRLCRFNMSPIMAAAIGSNVEITRLLLQYGHYIQHPEHKKPKGNLLCRGNCAIKKTVNSKDYFRSQLLLKNAYMALSSPAYIAHTDSDPILTAFSLSRELKEISESATDYQEDYIQLSQECSKFATALLNECNDLDEVHKVLQKDKEEDCPRLYLAKALCQKEFIAHPNSQYVLRHMWTYDLDSWWSWSMPFCLLYIAVQALLAPVVLFLSVFHPDPLKMAFLRVPLNRAIYKYSMYIVFLAIIVCSIAIDVLAILLLIVFCIGNLVEVLTLMCKLGARQFFGSFTYDFLMYLGFFVSYLLQVLSLTLKFMETGDIGSYYEQKNSFYIGEGIGAFATMMAFFRLFTLLRFHPTLGPLNTTLVMMMGHVAKFFVIIVIVLVSFAIGIFTIYRNYPARGIYNDNEKLETDEKNYFYNFAGTMNILLWVLLGDPSKDYPRIVMPNESRIITIEDWELKFNYLSEYSGTILLVGYHTVVAIILLNMLIAVMNDSFINVQQNLDVVWKFSRSSFWMSFFKREYTRPSPFNLIPSVHCFKSIFCCFFRCLSCKNAPLSFCRSKAKRDEENSLQEEEYSKLMKELVLRYLRKTDTSSSEIPKEIIKKRSKTSDIFCNHKKKLV